MDKSKQYRTLEIFFRCMRGEDISVAKLANEYNVSKKSITRSINELKAFLPTTGSLLATSSLNILTATNAIDCIWTNF